MVGAGLLRDERPRTVAVVEEGFILVAGPVGDYRQALHLVAAESGDEVRRRAADDPWARAGLLEVGAIQPWDLWLDFRRA